MNKFLQPAPAVEIPLDVVPKPVAWMLESDLATLEKPFAGGKVMVFGRDAKPEQDEAPRVALYNRKHVFSYFLLQSRATRRRWTTPNWAEVTLSKENADQLEANPEACVPMGFGVRWTEVNLLLEKSYLAAVGGELPGPRHEGAIIQLLKCNKPGLLKARFVRSPEGAPRDWTLRVEYGEGVSEDTAALLALHFTEERIPGMYESEYGSSDGIKGLCQRSFLHEALKRKLDPASLRFEIRLTGTGKPLAKQLRRIRVSPGRLKARWASDEGSPDLCTSWWSPVDRRDSRWFGGFIDDDVCFPYRMDIFRPYPEKWSLRSDLVRAGFDVRTIKVDIDHTGDTSKDEQ